MSEILICTAATVRQFAEWKKRKNYKGRTYCRAQVNRKVVFLVYLFLIKKEGISDFFFLLSSAHIIGVYLCSILRHVLKIFFNFPLYRQLIKLNKNEKKNGDGKLITKDFH